MGHISVILPLPIVLLNMVVGQREWWAQIPLYPSLRHRVSQSLILMWAVVGHSDSHPALLGATPEGGQAAFRVSMALLGQSLEMCILQKLLRVIVRLCSRPTKSFSS